MTKLNKSDSAKTGCEIRKKHHKHSKCRGKKYGKKLIAATTEGDLCKVQKVLNHLKKAGLDLTNIARDRKTGVTPLHVASLFGYADITEVLLNCGMNPNSKDHSMTTPLHLAVSRQHREVIILLLRFGADRHIFNNSGESPLSLGLLDILGPEISLNSAEWHEHLWQELCDEGEADHGFYQWQDEAEEPQNTNSWMDDIAKQAHAKFTKRPTNKATTNNDHTNKATTNNDHTKSLEEEIERDRAWRAQVAKQTMEAKKNMDDDKWAEFSSCTNNAPIHFQDVPWPTGTSDNILNLAAAIDGTEKKSIIRSALLRWHPDKFMQVFGARLVEKDKAKIVNRVKEITQQINAYTNSNPK